MVDATVFAKTEASLISFKCNNFQLLQKSDEGNLHLDKNGICIKCNAKFNILNIQDVKIYTKEDCKEDELLTKYFELGEVWISEGHFKNLTVNSLYVEVFHSPWLFSVENMQIDFYINSLDSLSNQSKLLDFAERAAVKNKWKVKHVFISVLASYMPQLKKKLWSIEGNLMVKKGEMNIFFSIFSLPVNKVDLRFRRRFLEEVPEEYLNPF
jgi:hypothetical protein